METKFYICRHCGNIIAYVHSSGVRVVCCGEEMQELVPNTVDASLEKHVPVIVRDGNKVTVTVGSVEHPMVKEHYIEWIELIVGETVYREFLKAGDKPTAFFPCSAASVSARAYCNLHGLWKA